MAKYSFKLKLNVVLEYLDGQGGYGHLAQKHGVTNQSQIQRWVNSYNELGEEGLYASRKNSSYTFDFKLSMVESYLTGEMTYRELANSAGMNNSPLIANWVRSYRENGLQGLYPKTRGRPPIMKSKELSKKKKKEEILSEEELSRLKILERENLLLRIENDFLKEMRRLRLEETRNKKKRQESSTASEDPTN